MKACTQRRNLDLGFTFLELMVALALLGMLSLVLFGSLRFGTRVWEHAEGTMAAEASIRTVQFFLRRDIERTYPLVEEKNGIDRALTFVGKKDRIIFMAAPLANTGMLERITIYTEGTGHETILARTTQPELAVTSHKPTKTILLHHIKTIVFSYYGRSVERNNDVWQSTWENRSTLPKLIQISIAFSDDTKKSWPLFIVAPRISSGVGCAFDVLSHRCIGGG